MANDVACTATRSQNATTPTVTAPRFHGDANGTNSSAQPKWT
jgi:hypothetical protein